MLTIVKNSTIVNILEPFFSNVLDIGMGRMRYQFILGLHLFSLFLLSKINVRESERIDTYESERKNRVHNNII